MSCDPFAPIAPHLKTSQQNSLHLSEKSASLSGDSANVKDENGNIVFSIKAKHMTLSERRELLDSSGKTIAQLRRKKSPGMHLALYIGTPDDDKHCMVKAKDALNITNCNADIYLGDDVIGEAKGNWKAKVYEIKIKDRLVANVTRKKTASSIFMDADSYCIDVCEGVDTAFVTLVALALDELYHDK